MVLPVNEPAGEPAREPAREPAGEPAGESAREPAGGSAGDARRRVLDAAEARIVARGIRAMAMTEVRDAAGVSLKRLYALYPTKEALVDAVLDRRDEWWRGRLRDVVDRVDDPRERLLAVFDWLAAWFAEPGFRGCTWINAYGEMGATSPAVLARVREHKDRFAAQLTGWAADAGLPPQLGAQVLLLAEGAMVTAAIQGSPAVAATARDAAAALLGAAAGRLGSHR
ncbi:TetR/AcrR family transcriptional regulator [Actinoplanes sp. N902-109]|uniref:TetR/AcrR family transcriptional regulator n=1 Tax=Actinoplanes sp. (strain N902-109) TaxID=649831 RepID=UPI0003293FF5|nr:TetR/AcrR family transcriptional regulator [Actinoplanes sp. N902-109]AGL16677.1 putative regulatory protein [Actinoplanes sp. N902-109]